MDIPKAIIIAAIIISLGDILSSGFFSFSSDGLGVANRYNKFTGSISMCTIHEGCEPFTNSEEDLSKAKIDWTKPLDDSMSNK